MRPRPRAFVSRDCPGQVRFKLPDRRRDERFFRTVAESLSGYALVDAVETNPRTGSVLVHHRATTSEIASLAEEADLFVLADRPERVPPASAPGTALDLRASLAVLALFLGLLQLARGRLLGPAVTLFWIAVQLYDSRRPATHPAGDGGEE